MKQYWKVYYGKIWNIIVLYNLMLLILTQYDGNAAVVVH